MTPAPSELQPRPPWLTGSRLKDHVLPWALLIPSLTVVVTLTVPLIVLGAVQRGVRRGS